VRLEVTVIHAGTAYTGSTQNVSLGGVLLTGDAVGLPFGAAVELQIPLPALDEPAVIAATVRWIRDGAVGLQFGSLRAKEQWALNQLMKDAPRSTPPAA
jgi:type IV pilus assembly protein PilZ